MHRDVLYQDTNALVLILHSFRTIYWKVRQRSGGLFVVVYAVVCILVCLFVTVYMYVRSRVDKKKCETQMRQRAQRRGTMIGPRISPSSTQCRGTTMAFVGHPVDLTHS